MRMCLPQALAGRTQEPILERGVQVPGIAPAHERLLQGKYLSCLLVIGVVAVAVVVVLEVVVVAVAVILVIP